jgi:hypothetical protein
VLGRQWRRRLCVWKNELLGECISLLAIFFFLLDNTEDRWVWLPISLDGYTIKYVCHLISYTERSMISFHSDIIGTKQYKGVSLHGELLTKELQQKIIYHIVGCHLQEQLVVSEDEVMKNQSTICS